MVDILRPRGPGRAAVPQVQEQMLASLLVMAWVVEARDPYTGGHLWRVSRFAELLARDAGSAGAEKKRRRVAVTPAIVQTLSLCRT
ncbi:MAG: hypothetical protein ACRERY_03620 [Pseudomonas sp.]